MAKLTTDTEWTATIPAGTYDMQKKSTGDLYIGRGPSQPTNVLDAIHIDSSAAFRFTVADGETAYFFGDNVVVYYYKVY
ncbi:MAG TPA: hypothetical protein CFH81_00500 [Sulfurovum sp. UBA12169]|nr:MAG TPA: hypothetical protein CFH81_00500 [Sulfurovum sp. UBA12169]